MKYGCLTTRRKVIFDGSIFDQSQAGGIARMFVELLQQLPQLEPALETTLLVSRPDHPWLHDLPNVKVRRLSRIHSRLRGYRASQLPSVVRGAVWWSVVRPSPGTVWHSTYYTDPGLWPGIKIVTVYDLIHETLAAEFASGEDRRFRSIKRRAIDSADAIMCISQATASDLHAVYPALRAPVFVCPLAASESFSIQDTSPTPFHPRPYILFVGRRRGYKNFDTLVQAYDAWARRQNFDLVCIGPAPDSADLAASSVVGNQDNLHFLTNVSDDLLRQAYQQAAAFVFPSRAEGFGIPILEALRAGCPVAASDIPVFHEVGGNQIELFDPMDPEDIMTALDRAVNTGRNPTRVAARRKHSEGFSWRRFAEATLEVYDNVV